MVLSVPWAGEQQKGATDGVTILVIKTSCIQNPSQEQNVNTRC